MGAPSQAEIHSFTDHIAQVLRLQVGGALAGYGFSDNPVNGGGKTVVSLFDLVDASADPDVSNALGPSSDLIDRRALRDQLNTLLPYESRQPDFRSWVTSLDGLVRSPSGGAYASLRAYLEAKAATLDPLAGEVVRSVLGEGSLTNAGVVTTVFAPPYRAGKPDRVYTGADGALAEDTTDANSATAADVPVFTANNQSIYIGFRGKFSGVVLALSTLANVTIAPAVEFWNGNAWVPVPGVVDNSAGLTRNDLLSFTPPADWQRSYKDKSGANLADLSRLYYLRIQRTAATVATPPVVTSVRVIPTRVPVVSGGAGDLGWPQPPLAVVRVTGVNTMVVTLPYGLTGVDIARFKAPALQLVALTPFPADLTITLAYVDQAGADDSQAQSAWSAPAALAIKPVALAAGDTGARSIRTSGGSIVTTNTQGVFVVESVPERTPAI